MNKELKCNIKFNRESKRVYKIELVSKWSSGKQFFTWELNINTFELLGISKIDKNINNEYNNDLFNVRFYIQEEDILIPQAFLFDAEEVGEMSLYAITIKLNNELGKVELNEDLTFKNKSDEEKYLEITSKYQNFKSKYNFSKFGENFLIPWKYEYYMRWLDRKHKCY